MGAFQAVILGLIQGITEFLPISSSGHLVISQTLLGFDSPPVAFDVLVHFATLLAVVVYFRSRLINLKTGHIVYIILATIPAVIAGLLIQPYISQLFHSTLIVGIGWLISGSIVISTKLPLVSNSPQPLTAKRSLIIGLWQTITLIPGISRSGITISAGLHQRLKPINAFNFSFFMAIPAITGAALLNFSQITGAVISHPFAYLWGFIAAALAGYAALAILERTIISKSFYRFGYYCLVVGLATVIVNFI